MYNALSVARFIVDYCNSIKSGISNLKLQKILYFVQADFLVSTPQHTPCFSDEIEAWDFGPVVPSVYHHYKVYGSSIIPSDQNDPFLPFYIKIKPDDEQMITAMIDALIPYSASQLVAITHNQSPWQNAYIRGLNNVISKESIKTFFEGSG